MWLGVASNGHMDLDDDDDEDIPAGDRHPVAKATNNLHTRLKSLELAGLPFYDLNFPKNVCIIPGHRTTPQLIKVLVHLSIDNWVPYSCVGYFLIYC